MKREPRGVFPLQTLEFRLSGRRACETKPIGAGIGFQGSGVCDLARAPRPLPLGLLCETKPISIRPVPEVTSLQKTRYIDSFESCGREKQSQFPPGPGVLCGCGWRGRAYNAARERLGMVFVRTSDGEKELLDGQHSDQASGPPARGRRVGRFPFGVRHCQSITWTERLCHWTRDRGPNSVAPFDVAFRHGGRIIAGNEDYDRNLAA